MIRPGVETDCALRLLVLFECAVPHGHGPYPPFLHCPAWFRSDRSTSPGTVPHVNSDESPVQSFLSFLPAFIQSTVVDREAFDHRGPGKKNTKEK